MEYTQTKKEKVICPTCGIEHFVVECAYCGKIFNAINPRNCFCSTKCKGDFNTKTKIEVICETCGKRFIGTKYAHNCPECVKKIQSETGKITIKQTLAKYGVTGPYHLRKQPLTIEEKKRLSDNANKANKVIKKRYGVNNMSQIPGIKEKKKETCRKNFGVDRPMQSKEIQTKSIESCQKNNGVNWNCQLAKKKCSERNRQFGERLHEVTGQEVSYEFPIGSYNYDVKCGKFLFEIDPVRSHNSSKSFFENKKPRSRTYHQEKSLAAEAAGYHCIHLFQWDNNDTVKEWIKGLLCGRKRLYHGEIRKVNGKDAEVFYSENHLQGKCSATVHYGLYVKDKLINCMSFTCFKGEWTLVRFASLKGYRIAHGAEKLFKAFIDEYNPDYIVSFSDITKHSGGLYNALGFKLDRINEPSYWRTDINGKHVYRRRDCQKQNMHKIAGFDPNYKYLEHKDDPFWQQTEKELMESHGYLILYDAGMRKHLWENKKD